MSEPTSSSAWTAKRIKGWVRDELGVNNAVGFGLLSKLWSLPASLVTWYLMLTEFSDIQRGLYSIFQSIVAVQIFFELGLSTCVTQFISHDFGKVQIGSTGRLQGDLVPLGRIAATFRLAVKWYAVMAVAFFFGVGVFGWWFLSGKETGGLTWLIPWWLLCLSAALALLCCPLASLLEGCGQIGFVARTRFIGVMIGSLLAWAGIKCGLGLLTGSVLLALPNVVLVLSCLHAKRCLVLQVGSSLSPVPVSWKTEIWPFQWRIGLSAVSGFFILSFFNIPVAHFNGLEAAGRIGFTYQLVSALANSAFMWLGMRAPQYGVLVGRGALHELASLHRKTLRQAIGAYVLGALVLFGGFIFLKSLPYFASKLLSLGEVVILLVANMATLVMFGQAAILRAHKSDPFFGLSLVNALITALAMIVLTAWNGTFGACMAYAFVQWTVLVPATMVARRFLSERGVVLRGSQ